MPTQAIEEFRELYKREFGIELEPEEAVSRARSLLALYRAVLTEDGGSQTRAKPVPP